MPKNPWFSKKRIGYGVRPGSWQGWLLVLVFGAISAGSGMYFIPQNNIIAFSVVTLISLVILLLVVRKTLGDAD
ncbi:MAG: hypothetical protein GY784_10790 [Gammaproteobacteria bacterium]|nr:hypothetical protein [Gammaproteobacteria bacterium]